MEKCVSDEKLSKIVELYNSGFKTVKGIASMLELDNSTVYKALQYATKNGMCKYNKNAWKEETYSLIVKNKNIKVYCINNDTFYDSISTASVSTGCNSTSISECCKGIKDKVKSRYDKEFYRFKYI